MFRRKKGFLWEFTYMSLTFFVRFMLRHLPFDRMNVWLLAYTLFCAEQTTSTSWYVLGTQWDTRFLISLRRNLTNAHVFSSLRQWKEWRQEASRVKGKEACTTWLTEWLSSFTNSHSLVLLLPHLPPDTPHYMWLLSVEDSKTKKKSAPLVFAYNAGFLQHVNEWKYKTCCATQKRMTGTFLFSTYSFLFCFPFLVVPDKGI